MKHRQPRTTLYFYPACASPRVLVIRRGPSKWWHLVLWDRDTGEITPGSWFNGKLYPEKCDLSPRGDWMVLLAYRGNNQPIAWTALAEPPYAKAIVFWAQECATIGGGFFDGRLPVLWINALRNHLAGPDIRSPHPLEFGYLEEPDQQFGTREERLARDGWKFEKKLSTDVEEAWSKKSPDKKWRLLARIDNRSDEPVAAYELEGAECQGGRFHLKEVCWANWTGRSDICFGRDGALWTASPHKPEEGRLVFDLNGLEPRPRACSTPLPVAGRAQAG